MAGVKKAPTAAGVKEAHRTAAASRDALAAREVPNLVPSVFRGRSASEVGARGIFEAGQRSKDPIDGRFGDCVGVLAHVGGECIAGGGGGRGGWRIGGGGAPVCN